MKNKILSMFFLSLLATPVYSAVAEEFVNDYETGQIVVSATRTEAFIEDVPTTMEVITSQDIQRMGATGVIQALSMATGIETANQKGSINFRGMGRSYSLILINGRKPARLESAHDGPGFILSSIGVSNIERIEIIRGQASAMYGADAMGGVVNIITKTSKDPGGNITFSGGNKEFITSLMYDFGRQGNWDAIVNGSATDGIGIRVDSLNGSGYSKTGVGSTYTLNLDMGYHFNDDNELRFIGNYIHDINITESRSDAGVYTDSISNKRNYYNGAFEYRGQTDNHNFRVTPYATQSTHWSSSKTYFFTDFGIDAQDSWSLNDSNLITYGAEFLRSEIRHSMVADSDDNISRGSFFIQDEIFLFNDKLILLPSLRYDYDSVFGGELIPRLGATWEFTEGHRLKANVGKAYVAPTIVQLYGWESRSGLDYLGVTYTNTIALGNENLNPETAWGWELRYEGKYKNLSGSIGYFWARIEDQITSEFSHVAYPYYYVTNVNIDGKSTRQGVEAELAYTFADYFTVTLGYNWLDNKNYLDQRISDYATDVFSLGLAFYHPEWNFSTNIWGKYNHDYSTATNPTHDDLYSYYNVNMAMSKTWKDKYTLTGAVYNLFTTTKDNTNSGSISPLEFQLAFSIKF